MFSRRVALLIVIGGDYTNALLASSVGATTIESRLDIRPT
jgi:uncharacterized protein YgbK (DUF1537 family)